MKVEFLRDTGTVRAMKVYPEELTNGELLDFVEEATRLIKEKLSAEEVRREIMGILFYRGMRLPDGGYPMYADCGLR